MQILIKNKREMQIPHYSWIFIFFSLFFNTMNVSLPFEGHNVAYQCKGLDQSNIVCEYEVNLSTIEKVIKKEQIFMLYEHTHSISYQ